MAVQEVKIDQFTVFSNFSISFCKGINLLIGKNGVGKTHLLKMIYSEPPKVMTATDDSSSVSEDIKLYLKKGNIFSAFGVDVKYYVQNHSKAKHEVRFYPNKEPDIVFIPAKEMLTHAKGLISMKRKYGDEMPFDLTLLDIIEKAQNWRLKETPQIAASIVPILEKIINGVVECRDDGSFWVKKATGETIPFSMEADGLKKFGLVWQLLMNESISKGSIVLWDEPEASVNPENIPTLVKIMLELQRNEVQIVAATHNYNFARYFDIIRNGCDEIQYYSLYESTNGFTDYAKADRFIDLRPNSIDDAGEELYNAAIRKSMEAQ